MSEFMNEARELASQCWGDPTTSDRVMDVELAEVFATRIAKLLEENAALQQLINDVANKINGKAPIVHVASWGNELLTRINAARK
jgi:hypothetical protein